MKRFQKHIHPGVAAILVIIVLGIVQAIWWRGLVYKEVAKPGRGGGGGGGAGPMHVDLLGSTQVKVDTFAGDLEPGDADGIGYVARFDRPTGLALDTQGNLYVADTGNNRIRKVTPDGQVTTFAGSEEGLTDGSALQARFHAPCGVCVAPDGAVYVADTGNHCVRRIQNGEVTTLKGAQATALPASVAFLPEATPALLVADAGDKRLHRIGPDGTLQNAVEVPGPPTSVVAASQTAVAIPQTGTLLLKGQTLHNVFVAGGEEITDPNTRPALRHPGALCPFGDDWLVTDNDAGAVFLLRNGKAEVLAGYCSSGGPMRGAQDGDGAHARFNTLSGVVTDGKRVIYVADPANNNIRRINISAFVGH
ncbi:MAG TPA: hypothetical protein VKU00_32295 [Chthonomonadaceae bacterium]|nr:hypothetical protein [Chthonomonadaceae bacterium]